MRQKAERDDGLDEICSFNSVMSGHKREQKKVDGLKVAQHSGNIGFVPISCLPFLKYRTGGMLLLGENGRSSPYVRRIHDLLYCTPEEFLKEKDAK